MADAVSAILKGAGRAMLIDTRIVFAAKLRELIEMRGISQRQLAQDAYCDPGHLSRILNAKKRCSERVARALDVALDANEELLALTPPPAERGVAPKPPQRASHDVSDDLVGPVAHGAGIVDRSPTPDVGDDDVKRRAALQLIAAFSAGSTIPPGTIETVLSGIEDALGNPFDLDEWERVISDYDHRLNISSAGSLISDLTADIIALDELLKRRLPAPQQAGLFRVCSALSGILAIELKDSSDQRAARVTWATAIRAADASNDLEMQVWARGRAAQDAFFSERAPDVVASLVNEAIKKANGAPYPGLAKAYATRSLLAVRYGQAEKALTAHADLKRTFEQLPDGKIAQSVFQHRETQQLWNESYIYVHLGNRQADSALAKARALYPKNALAPRANLALMQAVDLVKSSEIDSGLQKAISTLHGHTRNNGGGRMLARSVLQALPEKARTLPAARELRTLISGT